MKKVSGMLRISHALTFFALICVCSGCYHHRLRANGDRLNSSYFRKTFEGKSTNFIVPPADSGTQGKAGLRSAADCKDNGLYEVGVTSHWKYAAGNVFTLGHWSRLKVEWLCAKKPTVIGPRGSGTRPPTPVETSVPGVVPKTTPQPRSKTKQDAFSQRTLHSFFWGGIQQNLMPPAPSLTSMTPANCKSMHLVKLPVNYGYSLITVFTAGIWSPMRVVWKCAEDASGGSTGADELPRPVIPGLQPGPLGCSERQYVLFSREGKYVPR